MRRLRLYIDTSVIGGCLDNEFRIDSEAILDMAKDGRIILVVSNIMLRELESAPVEVQARFFSLPPKCVEEIEFDVESIYLRDQYLARGIVGPASSVDAHHVALAVVSRADMIVSWNFRHIVHFEKIQGFNSVNIAEGYPQIAIYSPKEVV
ncbi:MAG: PIN domain-containing protein [Candidatus Hydrogenedentes bacterium]|nr:PIN domain-containing protein [Candidatus Hydrogenedentota bacterium]